MATVTVDRGRLAAAQDLAERVSVELEALLASAAAEQPSAVQRPASAYPAPLAWGAKVSPTFRDRVRWLAEDLGYPDPSDFMAVMAWESARSFRADVKNMAGSGATGLIQFMPQTAIRLGTTVEKLEAMTAEDQLNVVWKYFALFKGKLRDLSDLYMAVLWPAGVGKPDGHVLFARQAMPTTYRQNAGLDTDKDGNVTKHEAAAKVMALKAEGLKPGNAA